MFKKQEQHVQRPRGSTRQSRLRVSASTLAWGDRAEEAQLEVGESQHHSNDRESLPRSSLAYSLPVDPGGTAGAGE